MTEPLNSGHLTVLEKYFTLWPYLVVASGFGSLSLFVAGQVSNHILLEGYLRLAAFALFALFLLGLFRLREGQIRIDFHSTGNGMLNIDYSVRGRSIDRQVHELSAIRTVESARMPDKTLYNNLVTSDRTLRYRPATGDSWQFLTEVRGRAVPLKPEEAAEAANFINSLLPGSPLQ